MYVHEGLILPHLAALAILAILAILQGGHDQARKHPGRRGTQVTAPAQAG